MSWRSPQYQRRGRLPRGRKDGERARLAEVSRFDHSTLGVVADTLRLVLFLLHLRREGRIYFSLPGKNSRSEHLGTMRRHWALIFIMASLTFFAQPVASQAEGVKPPVKGGHSERSDLEKSLIAEALDELSLEEERNPHGKMVESIEIYVFKVFDDRDPVPQFVNALHIKTRSWVIRQEVLQRVGAPWDQGRVQETERNLRGLRQLSVANAVAVHGSTPDKVRLLIITKDVWSLRLNSDWAYGSSGLESLLLNPTEENLGGIRASLGLLFLLERDRYTGGVAFSYPRMFGTRISVGLSGGVIKNRASNETEGGYGTFSFYRPLYSRHSKWGYGTSAQVSFSTVRNYSGRFIEPIFVLGADGKREAVPNIYESERIYANYSGVRSWGIDEKLNLSFGIDLDHRRYRSPVNSNITPEARAAFEESALPVSDKRMSPYLRLNSFPSRFHRSLDIESLGLQEDFRIGQGLSASVFTASRSLGSSRDLVGSVVSGALTLPLGSGLARLGGSNRIVLAEQGKHEAFVSSSGRLVSPRTTIGRLHIDAYFGYRYQDYLNIAPFRLGGDNRLRGYATGALVGKNLMVANTEFRTRGVDILSAQVGLATFYDVGAAADELSEFKFYQGVGLGGRILFPQAERIVLRLDVSYPLNGRRIVPAFFFTFGQAFPMPDSSGMSSPFL